MRNSRLSWPLGLFSFLFIVVNTLLWTLPLLLGALLKKLSSSPGWRLACDRWLNRFGTCWVGCNVWGLRLTKDIHWDVQGLDGLRPDAWYLLVANHQSWVDIIVLQKVFYRRAPMLKFFLKRELIWVPVLGLLWWALDFPFMRRSASIHKDFETIRKSCEKFKTTPVTVANFLEGTRFTPEKHQKQGSPYRHLLKPKAVGIALALEELREQIEAVVDVTIVYSDGVPSMWDFLCMRSLKVVVRIEPIPLTAELAGDYLGDRAFRRRFNAWVDGLWVRKDALISCLPDPVRAAPDKACTGP